ncbi:hypothetical protein [Massilimicrobiota sp. SW1139]|uniref:hypothetical protein n=1 Tax=Massilimicrobiota sp. SW1139 TaxID=2530043 RepID=UPI00143A155A|nr:hypothetical protein [Massilimicrobiota sp. SW1139]NJE43788.1 hypothetical protein [Massilimicrobiota sp. SW1139]
MSRILMLWPNVDEDIPSLIKEYYSDIVDIKNLYTPCNSFKRIIRKLLSISKCSTEMFFDKWIYEVMKYDIIIIHANIINQSVPKTLRKKGYNGRIIYWYWNPVSGSISPNRIDRNICELWSFDYDDCKKYNMKYNSTYYFKRLPIRESVSKTDVFFIGKDKGRYDKLNNFKKLIENLGFSTNFLIIKDKTSRGGVYSKSIPYTDVINFTKESNCILEFLQKEQSGMSLRVMESLFFKKKLITDNNNLKDTKVYDIGNTYIIGSSSKEIDQFMKEPIKPVDKSLLEYYDFENWLNRFSR